MTKQELFWELRDICERFPIGINTTSACSALLALKIKPQQVPGFPAQVDAEILRQLENFVDNILGLLKACEEDEWEDQDV